MSSAESTEKSFVSRINNFFYTYIFHAKILIKNMFLKYIKRNIYIYVGRPTKICEKIYLFKNNDVFFRTHRCNDIGHSDYS